MIDLKLSRETAGSHKPDNRRHKESVRLLPPGQRDVRLHRFQSACELLADGFDDYDGHIASFVSCTPMPSRRSGSDDADQFLDWLESHVELDDEQRDFVAALRSRHAVEVVAVRQRLAHARFQKILCRSEDCLKELESNRRLTIRINPIHVWSQFETRVLLDDETEIPATVLFFPVGGCVRTVVVEPDAEDLLRDLESGGTMTIADLLRRTPYRLRAERLQVVRRLASVGAVAIGS